MRYQEENRMRRDKDLKHNARFRGIARPKRRVTGVNVSDSLDKEFKTKTVFKFSPFNVTFE